MLLNCLDGISAILPSMGMVKRCVLEATDPVVDHGHAGPVVAEGVEGGVVGLAHGRAALQLLLAAHDVEAAAGAVALPGRGRAGAGVASHGGGPLADLADNTVMEMVVGVENGSDRLMVPTVVHAWGEISRVWDATRENAGGRDGDGGGGGEGENGGVDGATGGRCRGYRLMGMRLGRRGLLAVGEHAVHRGLVGKILVDVGMHDLPNPRVERNQLFKFNHRHSVLRLE